MTSANVTHYELYYADTREMIATASQHALCKDRITPVLEKWEKEHPDAVLRMRWPDEYGVDQYLTFEDDDYVDEDYSDWFWADDQDTIKLTSFMRVRRIKAIRHEEHITQYLREKLWEYTGDPRCSKDDYEQWKRFKEFQNNARAVAAELGDDVRARTSANEGKFKCDFLLTCRGERDVRIAKEAIKYFYATGRIPTYDEPYPEED